MINQTLFASQSWTVCGFGSGFRFYVPSAAFLIVDRSSWQLRRRGKGPSRGTAEAPTLDSRGQACVEVAVTVLVWEGRRPFPQPPSLPGAGPASQAGKVRSDGQANHQTSCSHSNYVGWAVAWLGGFRLIPSVRRSCRGGVDLKSRERRPGFSAFSWSKF